MNASSTTNRDRSMAVGSTSCELTELPDKMGGHEGVGYDVSYIT